MAKHVASNSSRRAVIAKKSVIFANSTSNFMVEDIIDDLAETWFANFLIQRA